MPFVTRVRDDDWDVWQNADGTYPNEQVKQCILMDIRDELKKLNRVFECRNALAIPELLWAIKKNTAPKPLKRGKARAKR